MLGNKFIECTCGHVETGSAYDNVANQNMVYHIQTSGLCANCGTTERPLVVHALDWRPDKLCQDCADSFDWSDWTDNGVANGIQRYVHK
jgi:hypothetical protein